MCRTHIPTRAGIIIKECSRVTGLWRQVAPASHSRHARHLARTGAADHPRLVGRPCAPLLVAGLEAVARTNVRGGGASEPPVT